MAEKKGTALNLLKKSAKNKALAQRPRVQYQNIDLQSFPKRQKFDPPELLTQSVREEEEEKEEEKT